MEIDAIKAISMQSDMQIAPSQVSPSSFIDILDRGVERINNDLHVASEMAERYARGENVATDELMIAMEQAQLSLKLAVEVKNKLTAAYQELFRMQV